MAVEVFNYTPERGLYKIMTDLVSVDTPQVDIRAALDREYAERDRGLGSTPIVPPGRFRVPAWDNWLVWYRTYREHFHRYVPTNTNYIYFGLK
jgi:hypothetical protein